ncbi:hypothetical protein C8R41DRAFT_843473 [Lentinula lateritia]|uniref:Secreted protein n=1 Tax=Lentinula lateritia TaxID=40482 RepID=A0ABQ8VBF1_9AGAR|nr:hypothetical protein C8R41DRAFT_843473 [Lentinula lateritia]
MVIFLALRIILVYYVFIRCFATDKDVFGRLVGVIKLKIRKSDIADVSPNCVKMNLFELRVKSLLLGRVKTERDQRVQRGRWYRIKARQVRALGKQQQRV